MLHHMNRNNKLFIVYMDDLSLFLNNTNVVGMMEDTRFDIYYTLFLRAGSSHMTYINRHGSSLQSRPDS